ncbi:MAG: translational GTPase TypA [Clostridia bacterium]|jgi:GTP-binding protein|nr:translational GTPase TypA [Clostridia bacterium]MDD4276068.1 translational GTPase TypA [Clostridia bacterium]
MENQKIRNIAIIAHVDHGKTSLVNEMLKQGGVFRDNQVVMDRVMDSNAIERERGITILAKNAALKYKDYKINVIDTPGHADFGGEVERVLKMADGVLLVVDAYEGPMPQTRFVLEKALELNLKVIVVINKIDRTDARCAEVADEVLELLISLNATDEQIDSPIIYCSARQGIASYSMKEKGVSLQPLFETIIKHISAPHGDQDKSLQMLVSSTEHSDYVGKMAIGKIERGIVKVGQNIVIVDFFNDHPVVKSKVTAIYQFDGLKKEQVVEAVAGDIVCVAGAPTVGIGDTLCDINTPEALAFVKISEPSVEMTFLVNDSPFAGTEGRYVTSRHLKERLEREAIKDLSLKVYETSSTEAFRVCGRGEMHLSILIENMRRDGYEFQVSQPKVLYKLIDGVKNEPIDRLVVDVPEDSVGTVIQEMGSRKGELLHLTPIGSRMRMEFKVPSRGLFGYKSKFLTDTKGEGVMNSIHYGFEPYKGDIDRRHSGSLVAFEAGDSVVYGMYNAQERGNLFIKAGVPVYMGMVVGGNPKGEDLVVNVCKKKALSNMRSSASDDSLRLTPPVEMSLEECLEFIADDEYLEVTPKNLRIRKKILDNTLRYKAANKIQID